MLVIYLQLVRRLFNDGVSGVDSGNIRTSNTMALILGFKLAMILTVKVQADLFAASDLNRIGGYTLHISITVLLVFGQMVMSEFIIHALTDYVRKYTGKHLKINILWQETTYS